jgi:outer membrane protein
MKITAALLAFLMITLNTYAQEKWDLRKCIDYAVDNNLTVKQNRLRLQSSEVDYEQNRMGLLPTLNAGASHGYNFGQRIDPFTNEFASDRVQTNNLFLAAGMDLFNGFTKVNTMRQSAEQLDAAEYELERIKNDISLQICLAYLQVLLAKENIKVGVNQVAITNEQVVRMESMVEAGAMPKGSLYDIQAQLAQEELTLVTNQNNETLALLNLTQLLQLSREDAAAFDIVIPDLSDEGTAMMSMAAYDIYLTAKQNMPQVQGAEAVRRSAEYGLRAARGLYTPSLTFSAAVGSGYSGANTERIGNGTNLGFIPIGQLASNGAVVVTLDEQIQFSDSDFRTKSFGDQLADNFNQNVNFNLSIPIFNGSQARANVMRSKIALLDADLNYNIVTNTLRFEVEQAYADAKAAMNSYIANQKAVSALDEAFKYSTVRYEQKVINAVDFNLTKTQFTNAQIGLINAKYDFIFRTKILDFYLGNPITL